MDEAYEHNGGNGPGMVAYGHGYDATRQQMIYRRILAIDGAGGGGGGVDRGYEGGDEDTGTGTSNSGVGSASASGRTSPHEERGRPRRGSSWWGMGYGFGSSSGGGGHRQREMDVEATAGGGEYDDYDSRPLLARPGWNVGVLDGLLPSPVSPAVTAIRYGSNDNTPRPGNILGIMHDSIRGRDSSQGDGKRGGVGKHGSASDSGSRGQGSGGGQASSGVDDIIPLPPALDSGSEIDVSPSSAAAAELERLRSGGSSVSENQGHVQLRVQNATTVTGGAH